ncbi:hypothetical protein ACQP2T_57045 [Nonomuraea sp. CA-143628]|uniref:hypothetical protein n=1 Tax=Nonomuraea sp. CA-143628 TaxID=3239997 RepID=UPI003D93B2CF
MNAKALVFAGLLMVGSGILTGILPVTSGGEKCGSAFVGLAQDESLPEFSEESMTAGCDDIRNLVNIPAIVLMTAGGATLCAAGATRWRISLAKG